MWTKNSYFLTIFMVAIGFAQGSGQINAVNQILKHQMLEISEKELAASILLIGSDFGVVIPSIVGIILDNTIFEKENQ